MTHRMQPMSDRAWLGRSMRVSRSRMRAHFRHRLLGHGALSVAYAWEETKEVLHMRHLQRMTEALVYSHQGQTATVLMMRDIGADESADSGRVHVRNFA